MKKLIPVLAVAFALVATPCIAADGGAVDGGFRIDKHRTTSSADQFLVVKLAPESLTNAHLDQIVGANDAVDFVCGAAAGFGFALALSGIGAPVGLALAGIGFACAMAN